MAPASHFISEAMSNVFRKPQALFHKRSSSRSRSRDRTSTVQSRISSPDRPESSNVLQRSTRVVAMQNQSAVTEVNDPKGIASAPAQVIEDACENSVPDELSQIGLPQDSVPNAGYVKLDPIVEQSHSDVSAHIEALRASDHENSSVASDIVTIGHGSVKEPAFNGFTVPLAMEDTKAHLVHDVPATRPTSPSEADTADSVDVATEIQANAGGDEAAVSYEGAKASPDATDAQAPDVIHSIITPSGQPQYKRDLSLASFGSSYPHSLDEVKSSDKPPEPVLPARQDGSRISHLPPAVMPGDQGGEVDSEPTPVLPTTENHFFLRVEEHTIEPLGLPLPSTYAEATNLAMKYPEIADQILKLPLSTTHSDESDAIKTGRDASTNSHSTSPDRLEDESRGRARGPTHTTERPNWALAPNDDQAQPRSPSRPESASYGRRKGKGKGKGRRGRQQGMSSNNVSPERGRTSTPDWATYSTGQEHVEDLIAAMRPQNQAGRQRSSNDQDGMAKIMQKLNELHTIEQAVGSNIRATFDRHNFSGAPSSSGISSRSSSVGPTRARLAALAPELALQPADLLTAANDVPLLQRLSPTRVSGANSAALLAAGLTPSQVKRTNLKAVEQLTPVGGSLLSRIGSYATEEVFAAAPASQSEGTMRRSSNTRWDVTKDMGGRYRSRQDNSGSSQWRSRLSSSPHKASGTASFVSPDEEFEGPARDPWSSLGQSGMTSFGPSLPPILAGGEPSAEAPQGVLPSGISTSWTTSLDNDRRGGANRASTARRALHPSETK
ncbi:uncharacterized protein LAESUDRAFT_177470 [Laetiporus sulphureus 93-53]|uniref:Uncharacterized protein n=1 Tax=Laetiporus sulphureus 93-53 TaxID=1314785 RepID=A0A165E858_9APHY|nr:uncharacterized protein LAESUDRAFT_177470 [Laetiporus sulphureus 93-53]KZT06431.1 hypothetical protein LAESUDRAFT_177470 [Laetiporus sulphureus 93-53]